MAAERSVFELGMDEKESELVLQKESAGFNVGDVDIWMKEMPRIPALSTR